ncbi:MAG: hypothetical protein LBV54_03595 [Puniceicoccales bacterium]|jgi:hypothetical protein|nr:hypothetical protein [Puniceicoccales bacterium]
MSHKYFWSLACGLAFGISAHAAADGLIGRWTFDGDAAQGGVRNAAADKYHATASGALKTVPGVIGDAVEFSGQAKVEVSPEVLPVGLSELTFSAWVAPSSLEGNPTIFRKEDSGRHGDNRLFFGFRGEGKFLSLGLNCGGNYAECDAIVSPAELSDGRWHLVAGTFDGRVMRVWLDGREIGSFERQTPLSTVHDFAPMKISRDAVAHANFQTLEAATVRGLPLFIGSFSGKSEFFKGKLDDARFYSKALDAKQLTALFAEGRQAPDTNTAAEIASKEADSLYKKADTFLATLLATDEALARDAAKQLDSRTAVELQRRLRSDFPEEVNVYILKWQKSPVANLLLSAADRAAAAQNLAIAAFEYLPLTEHQWNLLSKPERAKWERAKWIKSQFAEGTGLSPSLDKIALGSILYDMENLVDERPMRTESVARYVPPQTPETKDRTAEEVRKTLEADWLFQCDGKPTVQRSLQEIGWARQLVERIGFDAQAASAYLEKLNEFETQAKAQKPSSLDPALYFAVREVKRGIMFKNPIIDFDSLLYTDSPNPSGREWQHETRHRLGYMAVPGGRLLVQKGLSPAGKFTQIAPSAPIHGTFWRPDLSFDATKILFSFKPHNEKAFHLYEIGIDGTGLRQLTGGIFDDFDPVYLPDGKNIMFLTTRGHIYVRCMPPTNAFVTARMALDTKPGDKNLYIVSRNGEPEYTPSVMHDGRVIYTRWEYTDKPLWRAQSLWTMRQDATNVQTFWGNQSVWPDLLKDARQIPGSNRIMFTGSAHHNWFSGSIGIIDPAKGLNFPDGLTKVTAELEWPESGNGPVDPKESPNYHVSGKYGAYYSPYPLGEKDFLVSAQRGRGGKFVLLLMDTDGNRELINEGTYNIWDAQPVRKRPVPPVQPDLVTWPTYETRSNPAHGKIYSNNVYEGADPALKDKAKFLRIWSIEHKTYTYWFKRNYVSSGPEISAVQSEGVKKIIGTVPIEADGSVNFNAPPGIALHFQLLDENQRALQTMKSFTGVQPGEVRGCFGCHESHMLKPVAERTGKALLRKASEITPVPWNDITVGYERYVQPALDKYCGSCHQNPENIAYKAFNATLRPGFLGFKEPYMTLLGHPTWGSAYKNRAGMFGGGYGWADTILIEAYSTLDPKAYSTYPAMTKLSYKSRLVERMASGKHHGVKVDPVNLLRVIHWVDAMGPYNGAEEVRKMEDPRFPGKDWLAQRPRIHTAPIVQRPGPFDPFETDSAYDSPSPDRYNALPPGVTRKVVGQN